MTSSVMSPFDSPCPLSYRLPIVTDPLSPFLSDIFDLKVADIHTHKQNATSSDNKGRLKLSAREPTNSVRWTNYIIHLPIAYNVPNIMKVGWQ